MCARAACVLVLFLVFFCFGFVVDVRLVWVFGVLPCSCYFIVHGFTES